MTLNKINPILKCVLCLVLCVCMCFSMCFLRPVEVKASAPIALAALSAATLTISLFSWFGWSIDVGEELTTTQEFKDLYSSIGYNSECWWHFICGDFTKWHLEKYGYLHSFSEWYGYYLDENGKLCLDNWIVDTFLDDEVSVDWDKFEEEGTISFKSDTSFYNDTWFEIQEFMHGGGGAKYLSELVKEVSTEPTLTELRDSVYNLYLGPIPYTSSSSSYNSSSFVYDKTKGTAYKFDGFDFYFHNGDSYAGRLYFMQDYGGWKIRGFHIQFWKSSYSAWNYCSTALNTELTAEDFESKWGISVPYSVTDSDGNTNTYCYLFNYNKDVVVRSSHFAWHELEYGSYTGYDSTTATECIDKFDSILESQSSSSSSSDDDVRNSATANKYAGTVDDDDGNPVPVTAPGQAGTTTVTGASAVTNPVTGVKGEDYANGTSVPMTGTVTGSSTVTQTDTGVKTDVGTVVSTATVDYPDGFEAWEPSIKLLTKFPFCIPYDFYSCFAILYKEPKELYFEIPFKMDQYGLDEKVVIDLRQFDSVVLILRYLILIGFIMFLTLKTRELIKG